MPRWLRIALRIFTGIVGILFLLWTALAWYVHAHKQELLRKLTTDLGERVGGTLVVRDMSPSLWKSFPDISLALEDVSLRDSQWARHRHSLLEVKHLYVQVNTFRLFSHKTEIRKITAADGSIFLYTDSNEYSNAYLLSRRDTTRKARPAFIRAFGLEDVVFYFINEKKQKHFQIDIRNLDGTTQQQDGAWLMAVNVDAHIHQLAFNTTRGGFLRNQDLDARLRLQFHPGDKELHIPEQQLRIGGNPILLAGDFFFNRHPSAFNLRIRTDAIAYRTALAWVSPNISGKLSKFNFTRPLALDARISGVMQYRSIPLVTLHWTVTDNELQTPAGSVTNTSFQGNYLNEVVQGAGRGDDNSRVMLHHVDGSWQQIPFHADTLSVTNLLRPYVVARIRSHTPLTVINDITDGNTFLFNGGTADADIRYEGGILPSDPTPYGIDGFIKVSGAGLSYLPRNLSFNNVGATVLFRGDNLYLRDVALHSKGSSLAMEGEALHFLSLYFTDPAKVTINWRARSPLINLNDFLSFVGRRKTAAVQRKRSIPSVARVTDQLNRVLDASSIVLDARLDRLIYKDFTAGNVVAKASLAQSGIIVEEVQLSHGGGTLALSGVIRQEQRNNPFSMQAKIDHADVAAIFKSFNDFGQTAISWQNLGGRLTATAAVTGQMTEGGNVIKNSMSGYVQFQLEDGALRNFSPFEKISRFAFKKRNLGNVTFKDIHNRLDIDGPKITIHPMTIESSAINMNVQGVYSLTKGTDIYMEIPLRNPEKEAARTPIGALLRRGKGFVLHLRAQDGDENGVKIGWDPLRHGRKATEELLGTD